MALSWRSSRTSVLLTFSLLGALLVAPAASADSPYGTRDNETPNVPGWHLAGSAREKYDVKLDTATKHGGTAAAKLTSSTAAGESFGTLMQSIDATPYRGKRLRMSAWLKTKDVAPWSGLWMRVDTEASVTAFDNMESRAVKGSTEWARYEVVLDVSKEARAISFGTLLVGTGTLWIDDVQLSEVGNDVTVTNPGRAGGPRPAPRSAPTNLSFETATQAAR